MEGWRFSKKQKEKDSRIRGVKGSSGERQRTGGLEKAEGWRFRGLEEKKKTKREGFEDSRVQVEKGRGLEGLLNIYTSTHLTI